MKNLKRFSLIAAISAIALGVNAAPTADAIYTGGPIITMNDAQPKAEALAVKDGKILALGSRAEI